MATVAARPRAEKGFAFVVPDKNATATVWALKGGRLDALDVSISNSGLRRVLIASGLGGACLLPLVSHAARANFSEYAATKSAS